MSDDEINLTTGFDSFFELEYPGLVGVATAYAGLADAEDLVQDTMVRALLRWGHVRQLQRPGGWVHRVLLNACIGRWRRRRIEARYQASLRGARVQAQPIDSGALEFWELVRVLPTRPRAAMILHYAGDRSTAEIAAILDVPEGTVKSDLQRARAALAVSLGVER
jgi:RNA polymerase sigma factor (sigma-70 family)